MKDIKKNIAHRPAPAASTAGHCPIYAKVAGRPGTGSYPTQSPSPTTQPNVWCNRGCTLKTGSFSFQQLKILTPIEPN